MWALCFIPLHLTSFFAAVINTNATPGGRLTRALNMRRNKLLSVDLYGRLSDEDEITLSFSLHTKQRSYMNIYLNSTKI